MAKSKKTLIIMLAVLVVCIAVLCIFTASDNAAKQKEEAGAGIEITNLAGDVISLTLYDGNEYNTYVREAENLNKWYWENDRELPVRSIYLNTLASKAKTLTALRTIEINDSMSAYGFDDPPYSISITDTNGETAYILIGHMIDDTSCYAMLDGGDIIYKIEIEFVEYMGKSLLDMISVDRIPSTENNDIRLVTLKTEAGVSSFRQDASVEQVEVENTDKATGEVTVTTEEQTVYTQYAKTDGDFVCVSDLEMGDKLFDNLLDEVTALIFASVADWKPDDAELRQYGLSEPYAEIFVEYEDDGETGSYSIAVGALAEDETYRYAMLGGSDMVCHIKTTFIDGLISDAGYVTDLI